MSPSEIKDTAFVVAHEMIATLEKPIRGRVCIQVVNRTNTTILIQKCVERLLELGNANLAGSLPVDITEADYCPLGVS
jgi:hypothetical protein